MISFNLFVALLALLSAAVLSIPWTDKMSKNLYFVSCINVYMDPSLSPSLNPSISGIVVTPKSGHLKKKNL